MREFYVVYKPTNEKVINGWADGYRTIQHHIIEKMHEMNAQYKDYKIVYTGRKF